MIYYSFVFKIIIFQPGIINNREEKEITEFKLYLQVLFGICKYTGNYMLLSAIVNLNDFGAIKRCGNTKMK